MKAVVLETRDGKAAVLVNDGTVRILHGAYNVGDIIDYRRRPRFVKWIAAAAAMVILIGGSAAMWIDSNYVTYAEVSLDVNPSIVYSINKRDRVLDIRAVNDDAERIVAELEQESVRFTPLSDAVEKTMTILHNQGYLDESTDDYVLINVSADDKNRQTHLSSEIETAMTATLEQNRTIQFRIDHSDRKTAKEADEAGMSTGRYVAWQQDEGASDRMDYADKPVRELVDRNPDENQQNSKVKPGVAPADDPQKPSSGEAKDQVPSGPTQREEVSDAPSDVQTPVESPAGDAPSSGNNPADKPAAGVPSDAQAPMEKTPADDSTDAQGPKEKQATDASPDTQGPTEKQASDTHPSAQGSAESDRASPERPGAEDTQSRDGRIFSPPPHFSNKDHRKP